MLRSEQLRCVKTSIHDFVLEQFAYPERSVRFIRKRRDRPIGRDLSRFDAASLIAFTTTKKMTFGTGSAGKRD